MFTAEFSIVCKLKVHESGYTIVDGKVRPIHKNSNTREENFSRKTYTDFMDLINHRSDKEALKDRLTIFCNKWGMPWEDNVKSISKLLLGFSQMKEFIQGGNLPKSKINAIPPDTRLTYQFRDGKFLPTFEVKDIYFAIELTFFLTSELEQVEYKWCKHYRTNGYRDGCMKRFPYKSNKYHCSPECKDAFNKKESRKKSQTNT